MSKSINVYYLGHSGFAVNSSRSLMVFDYWQTSSELIRPILDKAGNKIFFFSSHAHHDHYDLAIEKYKKNYPIEAHFVGWKTNDPRHISVDAKRWIDLDSIKVYGVGSNDDGVAYLTLDEDMCVFHGGDLAGWEDETWESFKDSIDDIKQQKLKIDIAFLAVTTFSGIIQKRMVRAAEYLIESLDPSFFFPMHSNYREYLYKDFKDKTYPGDQRIVCPEYPGETFNLEIKK